MGLSYYYDFRREIWNFVTEIKEKTGLGYIGLRLQEFDEESYENEEHGLFNGRGLILYVANSEGRDFHVAWKDRMAFVLQSFNGCSIKQLRYVLSKQIQRNVEEKFKGNSDLEKFVEGLKETNEILTQ